MIPVGRVGLFACGYFLCFGQPRFGRFLPSARLTASFHGPVSFTCVGAGPRGFLRLDFGMSHSNVVIAGMELLTDAHDSEKSCAIINATIPWNDAEPARSCIALLAGC